MADGSVPGAKLSNASVTTAKLAVDAVTTSALTDLNVTTDKLADSAITNAKLATGAITTAKIDAAGLGEAAIATNAVTTNKVLDGAITAAKLAADSTTIVQAGTPVGSGAYEGQLWFDTNTSVKYVWNGSAWIRQAALNAINFSDTTPLNFAVAYPDNHTANITTTLDTQAANAVFVGPTSGANAAPTFRALTPADLPNATASSKGIVQPGTGLVVNAGVLNHSNTVTPGTYTRLVVDAQGHVSQGQLLEASDIPSLDAAKITTGALPTARLADAAVTIAKMADYSTASIGAEFPEATFTGQLHLNSLDRSFYMWDGNVWVPIGISAGQIVLAGTFDASTPAGVGKIQSLTPEGVAAGFVVNAALPAPTLGNNKHYFVVSEGGTITSGNAPAGTLAPPDLLLSVYSTTLPQWVEIDVSAGAGAIAASNVSFVPAGDIAATNVQTAIQEVSTECRNADNITSGTLAVARGGTNVASYTKGDLLVASAATTLTKLPVGTNGQVLRANSATATGLEYGADFVGTVTTVTSSTAALTVATATTTPALTLRAATTSVDGIVQLSDSTSTTSSVLAATPTAVKSAYDLAALALPAAGGTVTGELLIGSAGSLVFEGSSSDGNETTLTVADPTADRTITLPNQTGTVLVSGNASIVNADVNASAAIAGTKINPDFGSQTVATTGRLLVGTSTATGPAILQVQTPDDLSTTANAGVRLVNTSTKTYPTSLPFSVIAGLSESIEIGNSASITSGLNGVQGNSFSFTKSAGNTQDINNLRCTILSNILNWTDLNTCANYIGIQNNFTYSGIDANSRTSSQFNGQLNNISLNCPDGQTQTIGFVIPYSDFLSITPAGSSTVNITNSFGQSLSMFNSTAGTKTINITTHTFLTTFYNGWGMVSFGSPGTMTANITTMYGLRLRAPGAPGTGNTLNVTNNWGLYQEWSSAKNWFAGESNQFPNITTTASGANAFLDSADSNRLYRSTSSLVYKRDIEDLDSNFADQILNLRPVWYRSKCDADCQDWSWYGLIAEEVAEIDPRFVHYGYQEDAYEFVETTETVELSPDDPRREEGIETEEVTRQERQLKADAQQVPNGVAYERLVVPLLDIIKRQKAQLDSFEARLTALESN